MTTDAPTTNGAKQIAIVQKLDPMYSLRQAMNRLFDEFSFHQAPSRILNDFTGGATTAHLMADFCNYIPKLDVKETDKEFVVTAELPGVKPHDVELKIVGGNLILHGEKHAEKEDQEANYYRLERSYGSFQRTVPIPTNVDKNAIQATTSHGVLRISLPKDKSVKDDARKIEITKS